MAKRVSNKIMIPALIVAGIIVIVAVWSGVSYAAFRSSGLVVTQERQVSGFTSIDLAGAGNLIVIQGDREGMTIEADDNVINKIETTVDSGVLKIRPQRRWTIAGPWLPRNMVYRVYVKDVTSISASGATDVSSAGTIATKELTVRGSGSTHVDMTVQVTKLTGSVSGSGQIGLTGTADQLDLNGSGSARFYARGLAARTATIKISGSGQAEVKVGEALQVDISGSGKVYYAGEPTVKLHVSGSGNVVKLGE